MIITIDSLEEMCDLMCDNRLPQEDKMTNKQAIWTLIDCRRLLIDGLVSVQAEEITEAFDMAIDALKYLEAMKGESHE